MTAEALPAELRRAIVQLARTPRLLVACDYDGTLAPIVDDPHQAKPLPESVHALRSLAALPATTAAVISGRALRDLATLSRLPDEVHLVGSHGSEFDIGFVHDLDPAATQLRTSLQRSLQEIVRSQPGVTLESKPASVAVHVRQADPEVGEHVLDAVRSGPATWDGVQVTDGKAVIELAVVQTDKGNALEALRHQVSATAAVFIGDDVTDEKAFARLHGPDLGLKVDEGDTLATQHLTDTTQVAQALAFLMEERRTWLYGEQAPPIERLTMLSNERTVALLTPDARVTWMCHPGPDSSAVFADLLGGSGAGHFSIRPHAGDGAPRSPLPLGQRYVPNTMAVETRWSRLLVTDYLEHRLETHHTHLTRVISGATAVDVEFCPRPEFGQVPVRLAPEAGGLRVLGTAEPMVLHSPGVQWEISSDGMHESAHAVIEVSEDAPAVLELRCGTEDLGPSSEPEPARREAANRYWSEWLAQLELPSVERELVARSALTLRGLCNTDTGGIMAAATTSLPEEIGGVRNWDYRYCWLRDGSMTVRTLLSLGSTAEAEGFLAWLAGILEMTVGPEQLHPLYAVDGSALTTEAVLEHLPGYAGSRPVRVGNAAEHQVQLDVFGPVTELLDDFTTAVGTLSEENWKLTCDMVTAVERRWHEPDHGIWEARRAPKHNVYTKVMCWVTVDRAIRIAERFSRTMPGAWRRLRETIAEDVITRGWNEKVGAYTVAYGEDDLDAACLFVGLSGLLPADDERFIATVDAIERDLRIGPTVFRYHYDDGLPGLEGGFHICTTWLIEAFIKVGRIADARDLFCRLDNLMGPTGLFPEEYEPVAEQHLGNHPQAYSHLGYIRVAQQLDELLDVASDAELDDGLDEVDI